MRDICRAHQVHPGHNKKYIYIKNIYNTHKLCYVFNAGCPRLEAKLFTHDLLGGRPVSECCKIPIESGGINFCEYVVIEGWDDRNSFLNENFVNFFGFEEAALSLGKINLLLQVIVQKDNLDCTKLSLGNGFLTVTEETLFCFLLLPISSTIRGTKWLGVKKSPVFTVPLKQNKIWILSVLLKTSRGSILQLNNNLYFSRPQSGLVWRNIYRNSRRQT